MKMNFLIYVTVLLVCFNVAFVYCGYEEYPVQLEKGAREREGGGEKAFSYPGLTKRLRGVFLTLDGEPLDLNRVDNDTANTLLTRYFLEEGLEAGLERVVRLAAVNHYIADEDGLKVDSFEIDELATDETLRSLEDIEELESNVMDGEGPFSSFSDGGTRRDKRSVIRAAKNRKWTNTTIPVIIPDVYNPKQKKILIRGLQQWVDATCLNFNIVESFIGPHIKFGIGRGCGSLTGMVNNPNGQTISITYSCLGVGTIAHEVGHALGFHHEQDRPDRDLYVQVVDENISRSKLSNFRRKSWALAKTLGLPYDYTSLLHYREYQFSINKNRTIITMDDDMHETIGNKQKISFYDAKMANVHYCSAVCEGGLEWDQCQNGGYRDPKNCSQCRCPDGLDGRFCTEVMDGTKGDCGAKVRQATGEWIYLTSPGYSGSGCKPYSSCNWLIQTEPGKHIELKVVNLRIDCWRKFACDEDYVAIRYKTNLALPGPRFCCDKPSRMFVSHGNKMLILFRVGDIYQNHGIRLQYRAVQCGGCSKDSALSELACLETMEVPCNGAYNGTCPDDWTKTCALYRKNNCLETIKKCCTGYKLSGDECKATAMWSEWSVVSTGECSVTCGNGTQNVLRARFCSAGDGQCEGRKTDTTTQQCSQGPCPVNGLWSPWNVTSTDPCTLTCGGGTRRIHRHRSCVPPMFGGLDCQGPSQDVIHDPCNTNLCPIDGVWSDWKIVSTGKCSVSCGGGLLETVLERTCIGPKFGGKDCQGDNKKKKSNACNSHPCPVDGVWSDWKIVSTGKCSVSCGGGVLETIMERTCIGPKFGGKDCQGEETKTKSNTCNSHPCPVDGVWSEWKIVSTGKCSVSCGGGVLETIMERTCIGPKFGGKDCQGEKTKTKSNTCNSHHCPVDGVWSEWKIVSTGKCSVSCGGGVLETIMERTCIGPKFGGKECQGEKTKTKSNTCNSHPCPVDGVWSDWKIVSTGKCSVSCGGGVLETIMERTCIGPKFGGKDCQGEKTKTKSNTCNSHHCPVDGVWSDWEIVSTGKCSVTCGGGVLENILERTCIGPKFGGKDCQGEKTKTKSNTCNSYPCSVDGVWSDWIIVSTGKCSVSCGGGVLEIIMERTCIGPKFGGKDCQGDKTKTKSNQCESHPCPVDGVWSDWKIVSTGKCSVTCGGGVLENILERTCIGPKFGGKDCQGEKTKTKSNTCNSLPCPVDGVWSDWKIVSTGKCSVSCGGGVLETIMERTCIGLKFGGKDCQGENTKTKSTTCNPYPCSVDGVWSDWKIVSTGKCSVSCGGGVLETIMERTCIGPKFGGKDCQGDKTKTKSNKCESHPCPVDGVWSDWKIVSTGKCSVSCGGGVLETILERTCIGPKFGGKDCQGDKTKTKSNQCESHPCPVDGVWSDWKIVSTGKCSVSCGGGVLETILERTCIGPKFGGKDCQGDKTKTKSNQCESHPCPVDGVWSDWKIVSTGKCSVTCGGGVLENILERTCIGPKFGGKDCQGEKTKTKSNTCNSLPCPVDGVWSDWKIVSTGKCSVSCGGGVLETIMERTCIGLKFGGKDCQGENTKTKSTTCNSYPCSVDGVWSDWKIVSTGKCSVSCGGGVLEIIMERKCIGPKFGGKDCQGDKTKTKSNQCESHPCPVDGVWSDWKIVSTGNCSVTCGGGILENILERICIGPRFGGKDCQGEKTKTKSNTCNSLPCPVDGVWSDWKIVSTGKCSVTCGGGVLENILERTCMGPKFGGKDCQGGKTKTKSNTCNSLPCPVDGVWSGWKIVSIGKCSVSCGGGVLETIMERTCIEPKFGGKDCQGEKTKTNSYICNSHPCPVDGVWSDWKIVSTGKCSVSCGGGVLETIMERTCIGPKFGGKDCQGEKTKTKSNKCDSLPCPVDGVWSDWKIKSTGKCSVTCGGGVLETIMERTCIGPKFGGKDCQGGKRTTKSKVCNSHPCPVDGVWSDWKVISTGTCLVSCGGGLLEIVLKRECIGPRFGGKDCQGDQRKTKSYTCNSHPCPVDGVWSDWKIVSTGKCSVICGGGVLETVMERTCSGPSFGGKNCQGNKTMTKYNPCNWNICPVDGVWSDWKIVSTGKCSATCGGGVLETIMERTCIGPKFGGKDCQGDNRTTKHNPCNSHPCLVPVDGVWSDWKITSTGKCSVTCGGGVLITVLERTCTGPRFGGKDCQGDDRKTSSILCNSHLCPVDGEWSEWKIVSDGFCSVTCGDGLKETVFERTCIKPRFGGQNCQGDSRETRSTPCNLQPCSVDGVWSDWKIIYTGKCSLTCGGGLQKIIMERTCIRPTFGGKDCQGEKRTTKSNTCNSHPCPVDGVWSDWKITSTGKCSVTCGGGVLVTVLERTCTGPRFGGKDCQGDDRKTTSILCNSHLCPVDGVWSDWKIISTGKCSVTCGGGFMETVLERTCIGPTFGGKDCKGDRRTTKFKSCNLHKCPVSGEWSPWSVTSIDPCTVTCGGGTGQIHRQRSCIRSSIGGLGCQGLSQEIIYEHCNTNACPINGVWSEWKIISTGKCSVTCGGGVMETVLERTCIGPMFGGKDCQGDKTTTNSSSCNSHHCPVDGVWSDWETVSHESCSVTCGGGVMETVMARTCTAPSFGGKDCVGNSTQTVSKKCNLNSCPVDGVWSTWGLISNGTCTVSCGGGYIEIVVGRSCIGPLFGGKNCQGENNKTVVTRCNEQGCREDGQWSSWKVVSVCSVSCGRGIETITYTRTCDNPAPAYGGFNCVGPDTRTIEQNCILAPCGVDGQWGPWTTKVVCSVTCGNGTSVIINERLCDHPAPNMGGKPCDGGLVQTVNETGICNLGSCTVDGRWSPWEVVYSKCSVTCGLGHLSRTRQRRCDNPAPQNGGAPCPGGLLQRNATTQQLCHIRVCGGDRTFISKASCLSISHTALALILLMMPLLPY